MKRLNPHDAGRREAEKKLQVERHSKRASILKDKRSKAGKKAKSERTKKFQGLEAGLIDSYQRALQVLQNEEDLGKEKKEESEDDE